MNETKNTAGLQRILTEFRRGAALINGNGYQIRELLEFEYADRDGRLLCLCEEGPGERFLSGRAATGDCGVSIRCVHRCNQHYALMEGSLVRWERKPRFVVRKNRELYLLELRIISFHFLDGWERLWQAGMASQSEPGSEDPKKINAGILKRL